MADSSNLIVDAFDALTACGDSESTWARSVDISRALGIHAINIGAVNVPTGEVLWARSSMAQAWLDHYMEQKFFETDPLIRIFATSNSRQTIYCDEVSVREGRDGGVPEISRALNEAGYELLHGTKLIGHGDPIGKMVTLCFAEMGRTEFDAQLSYWTTIAALFGSFSTAPKGQTDLNVFLFNGQSLSNREIEVLQLLATGLQTARIAERLDLAEVTVAKHFRTGRDKLGALTREQALIKAMQLGLISL